MRHHFFLSAFVVLAALCGLAVVAQVPVAPVFAITIVAEALFGLHLDNDRPLRFLKALGHAMKSDHAARMHHSH